MASYTAGTVCFLLCRRLRPATTPLGLIVGCGICRAIVGLESDEGLVTLAAFNQIDVRLNPAIAFAGHPFIERYVPSL